MTSMPTIEQAPQIVAEDAAARHNGEPAPGAGAGFSGRDVVRILRRRKWLIAASVAIWCGVALVATLLWLKYAPIYEAKAIIKVNPPSGSPLAGTERSLGAAELERLKKDHVRMIKRLSVLQAVVEKNEKVRQTGWFKSNPATALTRLTEDIEVTPVRETNHIEVSISAAAPSYQQRVDLAEIATAVAEAFVVDVRNAASTDHLNTIKQLDDERKTIEEKLAATRNKMSTVRTQSSDIVDMRERRSALNLTLAALNRERVQLMLIDNQAEQDLKALEKLSDEEKAKLPAVTAALRQDAHLPVLRSTEVSYANELEIAKKKFGPRHRRLRDMQARLENVRILIEQKEKEVIRQTLQNLREEYKRRRQSAKLRLRDVNVELSGTKARIRDVQKHLAKLNQLMAEESVHLENINRINKRKLELGLQSRREQPVYIASKAQIPDEPSMPKWSIMMPLGLVLGLSLGLALTFFLEFMDTSIRGPSDISRHVELPLLGMVPHTDDAEEEFDDVRLAFRCEGESLISESFRQMRTSLLFSGPAEGRRTLVITSPLPKDGRTTTALNLAAAIAHGGRKVLVVDANFRQPALGDLFPDAGTDGFSNALVGEARWQKLVSKIDVNLSILPAGPLPPNPAELFGSDQVPKIVAEMAKRYDQVIFDTAPCLVVADPCVLSTKVDGVVLVVRAGANSYGLVRRTRDMLLAVDAHIMGVTLNAVRVTAGGYLRKNYETFYQYSDRNHHPVATFAEQG